MERVVLRPLMADELAAVEECFAHGTRAKHRRRLSDQEDGLVVYVIAWLPDRPAGHALVRWSGEVAEAVRARLTDCPHLEDLFVAPELRSRGIGSRLLEACEALVRNSGYGRIGLSVGVENPRARSLYERRGYRDAGCGVYELSGEWGREECVYLVKELE